jgi:hypothetical protein
MSATPRTLEEIQNDIKNGIASEPVVLPGSDIGEGMVRISSWVGGMLAYHFGRILDGFKAENFLTIDFFNPKEGHTYTVIIQRAEGKTVTQKVAEMEKKTEKLKNLIAEAAPLAWTAHADMDGAREWEKKATELIK